MFIVFQNSDYIANERTNKLFVKYAIVHGYVHPAIVFFILLSLIDLPVYLYKSCMPVNGIASYMNVFFISSHSAYNHVNSPLIFEAVDARITCRGKL